MQGFNRVGNFDVPYVDAQEMLAQPNPHRKPNSEVLKPWRNARDVLSRPRYAYTIDFGNDLTEGEAALYEKPFGYLKAGRSEGQAKRANWWQYQLPSNLLRAKLATLPRYLVTGAVSKHHIITWLDGSIMPDHALILFTWSDDYHFGILQSHCHELWALAMGTQLREAESGSRYTPRTCFEMFPFPEPTEEQRTAVASAARQIYELRENWLNPVDDAGKPTVSAAELKRRTLTNLYNQHPDWLSQRHAALDAAVAAAYGWPAQSV